jgi:excisionase family DNA binding protein
VEQKVWLTAKEAATHLGIGLTTFYQLCQVGGLKHVRVGKGSRAQIRTTRQWADHYFESRSVVNNYN